MAEQSPAISARYGAREAMPMEGFLNQTEKMSLDDLLTRFDGTGAEGAAQVARQLQADRGQVAALLAKMYDGEMRPALEWLMDITLRRPNVMPGLGPEAHMYCVHRDGQNSVAWQIIQAIAEGRGETPPAREGQ